MRGRVYLGHAYFVFEVRMTYCPPPNYSPQKSQAGCAAAVGILILSIMAGWIAHSLGLWSWASVVLGFVVFCWMILVAIR
jgi:hypothetical protein